MRGWSVCIDSHAYMLALLGDAQAHGAQLICRSPVVSAEICRGGGLLLPVGGAEPTTVRARTVRALLPEHSPVLARSEGRHPAA